MYEQLFDTKLSTLAVMLLASLSLGALVSTARLGLMSILYNFVPAIAVAFYGVALIAPAPANTLDLIAGLIFELLVLGVFIRLFADVHHLAHAMDLDETKRALSWSLPVQLLLTLPVMSLDNFGIFADGSRIGFLGEAAWAKYLVYASVLLSAVQAPLVARLITLRGKVPALAWAAVLLNAASSVLGGSKGAVFLWLLAVAALVDWREARLKLRTIVTVTGVTIAGFLATVWFLSSVTGMEPEEFITLAFGRFLVTNDARSMAMDLRTASTGSQGMLRETLRSLAGLFGLAPKEDPLGALLYQELFGRTDGQGANGSLMAIATFFMPSGTALLPAAIASSILLVLAAACRSVVSGLGRGFGPLMLSTTALVCTGLYSQDILAFQVLAPLAMLIFLSVVALHQWRLRARPKLVGVTRPASGRP